MEYSLKDTAITKKLRSLAPGTPVIYKKALYIVESFNGDSKQGSLRKVIVDSKEHFTNSITVSFDEDMILPRKIEVEY